ncbi:MAG: 5,10-methylenetetrahydrofolate reductase [Candidatus Omnitrophica bacterium]|nr:5,10-methylenetetrahydrofolate reductase [Candidatus Omnitrophota bacterium]
MSKLKESLDKGKFVVTGEIAPPKGTDISKCIKEAEEIKNKVVAVNVTDLQSSVMKAGSLVVSRLLVEKGIEPVFQLTTRDRNRLALQSDLLSAAIFGIENVLCLTGDFTTLGDHPQAKPVFDLDSVQLLQAARTLESGVDLAGKPLEGSPSFFLGAVVNPGAVPLEPQLIKMEKKVKAGAQYFQTQAVYEPDRFAAFIDKVKYLNTPILAGIVLLKSAGMARFMNANVAGVSVPEVLIDRMQKSTDKVKTSIEITVELIRELRSFCQGIHLMPLGWADKIPAILEQIGI